MPAPISPEVAQESVAAVERHGSIHVASRKIGVSYSTLYARLAAAFRLYGLQPNQPKLEVPAGRMITNETAQYNAQGQRTTIWARQSPTDEAVEEWIQGLEKRVGGKRKPIKPVGKVDHDIAEIVVGDPHAGMYAAADETGSSYNLERFKSLHQSGPEKLLKQIGRCDRLVLAYMGDLFHADNQSGMTEKSKNILDMSGRWHEANRAVEESCLDTIDRCASMTNRLDVVLLRGNHSPRSEWWLARVLAAYYRKSSHIHIAENLRNRLYLRQDKVLLGYHHGDKLQARNLQMHMAQEAACDWGETVHRYWRCGHVHTSRRFVPSWDREEAPGCTVEYFPTLAGLEAYGAEVGHCSRRAMLGVVHDELHGELGRFTVTPEMLENP